MLKLKERFEIEGEVGYKPWYELALAIASKFDEGLRIVPEVQPDGPKAPRWKGAHRRRTRGRAERNSETKSDQKLALVLAASV